MANVYSAGKFNNVGAGMVTLENDATKQYAAIDEEYDAELQNMESVIAALDQELNEVLTRLKKIKNDDGTGKKPREYCTRSINKIETVRNNLNRALNDVTRAINTEEKAEFQRMKQWIAEAQAKENINTEI